MRDTSNIEKLYPKCLLGTKDPSLTNKGFFVPCCWCDAYDIVTFNDFKELGFFNDDLHLTNLKTAEDVENVFKSKVWNDFFMILLKSPKDAPNCCKDRCGKVDGKLFHESQR